MVNWASTSVIVAAVVGSGGIGAGFRDIVAGIRKTRRGMAAREPRRRRDVFKQRDDALDAIDIERDRADKEARNAREMTEYAARLRLRMIQEHGADVELPDWPDLEETMPRLKYKEARTKEISDGNHN